MKNLSQNQDLYFRLVPIKDASKQEEMEIRAKQQQIIINAYWYLMDSMGTMQKGWV